MAIEGLKLGMYKKVVVILPGSLRVNYLDHIKEYKESFTILAYNTISIKTKIPDLDETLVIIDECQNLTNMITNGSKIGIYLYHKINVSNCRVIAMSATPMINNTYEYVSLFNLLKRNTFRFDICKWVHTFYQNGKMINKKLFYDSINGLVSYYQGANEKSQIFPTHQIYIVNLKMSEYQQSVYQQVRAIEQSKKIIPKGKTFVSELSIIIGIAPNIGDYRVKSRQACNFVYPNEKTKPLQLTKLDLVDHLAHYSIKFKTIVESIKKSYGVVMVYSSFVENCLNIFETVLRYHNISSVLWVGGLSDVSRRKILTDFNHPSNIDGSKIKVILVSLAGAEGISLRNVQQIHIMEPYWNEVKIKQIIGRAIRICSHYTLPKALQHVDVYRYITHVPGDLTSDQDVFALSQKKYKLDQEFDELIKTSAFDCILNKKHNGVKNCFEELL